jgi:chemotaxis signal transduction protein
MRAISFRHGAGRVGLRIDYVEKIVRLTSGVRTLAGAPPCVGGLTDIRGRVVTLLDPGPLLGGEEWPPASHAAVLLEPRGSVALLLPGEIEILKLRDRPVEGAGPFPAEILECRVEEDREGGHSVALLDPAAVLAVCKGRVRGRFLERKTNHGGVTTAAQQGPDRRAGDLPHGEGRGAD